MRILLTGGGSGGHFYPLIAIAERLKNLARERKIASMDLYYMGNDPYDETSLNQNEIKFISVSVGKLRIYPSFKNFTDIFKVILGVIQALVKIFFIYPDVVIAKGGHGSFPALFAAKIFSIPVIIHESDTYPGRVNLWAGKFAKNIAVAYAETAEFFDKKKTAIVGLPIRNTIMHLPTPKEGAEHYNLDQHIPTIFVYAGSLGADKINNLILSSMHELLKTYQIIHQCGNNNIDIVKNRSDVILENHPFKNRYILKPFLNQDETRNAAALASLVISRAGSTLFEIASWHIPAIVIPITHSHGNHQHKNAVHYVEIGAGIIIEESNALPHLFILEVNSILQHENIWKKMHDATANIGQTDAALEIASQALLIGEAHELE
ncbi:hypothetical protein A3C57_00615 [Candidatus Nomurabacteria bacterium RIFCSPHIGHO2_02_FULL_33_12]|uniref:UDP-N-acetylglucosamine--N-acetylmuramyl-(pentapeptide) pyrophosphoryl-undecaprenol N-acetylglucosamine transferase n=1 Tax=Candidatus Nomurabacteria bacterium RIFCSPLOWO2_01_FULL_33_17 TaxID=1801764 RepID=A0A1F6WQD8_9BACT|nr:MAG: hypothetical protein A3C57_00615 [Candidatus Nomurabacteria bacterium RIFCSPHIGHO2_02_FULL_33_12]OGI84076.1 MAG: hypothetical protein A2903_02345 [Candidatus Nomurabacteria bacterium RIFCSPLOWO2_01_FULL_33_17]